MIYLQILLAITIISLICFLFYKYFLEKETPRVITGIEVDEKDVDDAIRFIPYVIYSDKTRFQISKPLNAQDLDKFLADYMSENFK